MSMVQPDQPSGKLEKLEAGSAYVPVDPGYFIVLAIGVIVPLLSTADFVAGQQHRHTLRKEERCQKVSLLAFP
jgi:hypothetical protein